MSSPICFMCGPVYSCMLVVDPVAPVRPVIPVAPIVPVRPVYPIEPGGDFDLGVGQLGDGFESAQILSIGDAFVDLGSHGGDAVGNGGSGD